jgi:hypothetical protein
VLDLLSFELLIEALCRYSIRCVVKPWSVSMETLK